MGGICGTRTLLLARARRGGATQPSSRIDGIPLPVAQPRFARLERVHLPSLDRLLQIGSSSLSPTSSPTSYFSNTSRPPPTHTQSYSHSSPQRSPTYPTLSRKPSFPLTPPRSRSSSLSHHHHPQAQSTSPPIYHSPTASKRVTQLSPLPASFVPGIKGLTSTIPSPTSKSLDGGEQPYPLSAADTNRVAQLHEGRIPTLAQLAPPDLSTTAGGASTAAIINTGNVGPMVSRE